VQERKFRNGANDDGKTNTREENLATVGDAGTDDLHSIRVWLNDILVVRTGEN
jgi:hypothetical protein